MRANPKFQKQWTSNFLDITNHFSKNQEQINFGIEMILYMLSPWSQDQMTKFLMKMRITLGGKVTKYPRRALCFGVMLPVLIFP